MRTATKLGVFAISAVFLTGCAETIASLTILSTKTSDFSQSHTRAASQASASDGRLWITILPLGGSPSIDVATNELLMKYNGDYLTDAKIVESGWSLLAVSYGSITVTGDVWKASPPRSTAPMTSPPPK